MNDTPDRAEQLPSAPAQAARRPGRARRIAAALLVFLTGVVLLLWYMGVVGHNVRTVLPGRVYRSDQLVGSTLHSVLAQHGIRMVINLRGGSSRDSWYRSEREECARLNVQHCDTAFSATHMPPPGELQKLLQCFDHATYPILFHCSAGADRSGMAGVLYLHLYAGVPLDQALERQLTWRYGHIAFGKAHWMDDFFALYRKTADGLDLRTWITDRYPALYAALPREQQTLPPQINRE